MSALSPVQFTLKNGAPLSLTHQPGRIGMIEARVGKQSVGWLSYGEGPYRGDTLPGSSRATVEDPTHHVAAMEVNPNFRRLGVGRAMLQHLTDAVQSTRIDPGSMTSDGAGLARGVGAL